MKSKISDINTSKVDFDLSPQKKRKSEFLQALLNSEKNHKNEKP